MGAIDAPFVTGSGGRDADELGERLMAGDIFVLRGLAPMEALVARARTIACEALGTDAPQTAETMLSVDEFRRRSAAARARFREDSEANRIWQEVMAAAGLDPSEIYADRRILRIQPSDTGVRAYRTGPLPPHRDTWGSNIAAQINWWGPVYPVTSGCTMLMWPTLFRTPVANTSAEWDLDELMRRIEAKAVGDYPLLPAAAVDPIPAKPVPVLIEPGELLVFSGAHLHGSVDNRTGVSRISIDTRSVSTRDLAAARGATNVDGSAPRVGWRWFHRVTDGAPLAPRPPGL